MVRRPTTDDCRTAVTWSSASTSGDGLPSSTGRPDAAALLGAAAVEADALGMARVARLARETRHAARPVTPGPDERPKHGVLRREGDVWLVRFGGVDARVRDTKGMADLAVLLARPGVEVHVAELVGAASALGTSGSTHPVLDETAIAAYRKRLRDLSAEEDDADAVRRRRPCRPGAGRA